MKTYKLAIVGATGVVGTEALKILEEKNLPISNYTFFHHIVLVGKKLTLKETNILLKN